MGKARSGSTDTFFQRSSGLQLDLCRELAHAFTHLCRVVCARFGHEGEKLIRDLFLSDAAFSNGYAAPGTETPTKRVNLALIKLLASRSMGSDAGGIHHHEKDGP